MGVGVNFRPCPHRASVVRGFCQITVPELFKLAWFINSWKVFVGTLQFVTVRAYKFTHKVHTIIYALICVSWNPYNLKAAAHRSSSHPFDDPTFNLVWFCDPTLESGINVAPRINVVPGTFGKNNKHSPLNKHSPIVLIQTKFSNIMH